MLQWSKTSTSPISVTSHKLPLFFFLLGTETFPACLKSWYIMKESSKDLNTGWAECTMQAEYDTTLYSVYIIGWGEMCSYFYKSIFSGGAFASSGGKLISAKLVFLALLKDAWLCFDCLCKETEAIPFWHQASSKSYILKGVNHLCFCCRKNDFTRLMLHHFSALFERF